MSKLTVQEAQAAIDYVRRAPLANMNEAEAVAGLLTRLKEHFEAHFNPPAKVDTPDAVLEKK